MTLTRQTAVLLCVLLKTPPTTYITHVCHAADHLFLLPSDYCYFTLTYINLFRGSVVITHSPCVCSAVSAAEGCAEVVAKILRELRCDGGCTAQNLQKLLHCSELLLSVLHC